MQPADRLIDEIVRSSEIPFERRRREVSRELKAHMEDFVLLARTAGHTDEETERLVVAHFGDPREIARQFGWVYRKERAALRFSVFVLSTFAVAATIAAIVLTVKAGIAIGLGVPLLRLFSVRHTVIEASDILATAAAYLGILSLERLFVRRAFPKAAAALGLVFAGLMAAGRMAHAPWQILLFGLVVGLFLRTMQVLLKNQAAMTGIVLACFGVAGLISYRHTNVASWLVTGTGYLAMTWLATRVDGALSRRLREL